MTQIVSIFTDGGVIARNPSLIGGVWAYRYVLGLEPIRGLNGGQVARERGFNQTCDELRPPIAESLNQPAVGNNLTELLALVSALEGLADGRRLRLYSDSQLALNWITGASRPRTMPAWLTERLSIQRKRFNLRDLHLVDYLLLAGHPNQEQLAAGVKFGRAVSAHNVWCDSECKRQAKNLLARIKREKEEVS